MRQNSRAENVTKLKLKMWRRKKHDNSKSQAETKFTNSKCDKTQKLKILQNSKNQNVTELKDSKCYKTQKLKMWLDSKTKMYDKTKNLTKLNKIKLRQKSFA